MAHIESKPLPGTNPTLDSETFLRSAAAGTLVGYLAAVAMTAAATFIAVAVDTEVTIPNLSLIFVVPVIVAGLSFGLGPSLCSAVLGALAFNYFLTEPRYTLVVDDPANIWAIALLFLVGLIVSAVAFTSGRRAIDAAWLKRQAIVLQGYSRDVAPTRDPKAIVTATSRALAALFEVPAVVILMPKGEVDSVSKAGDIDLGEADLEAARSSLAAGVGARAGVYPDLASRFDFWPVATASGQNAVLGLAFDPDNRPAAPERAVDVVAAVLALALDRRYPEASSGPSLPHQLK